MDYNLFKRLFPNLAKEIEENKCLTIRISSVRTDLKYAENKLKESYEPDVIDFLRRCNNEEEGLKVIDFLEKSGEISKEYAEKLRKQLKEKGIRSFGSKKEWGYYYKFFEECSE